MTDYDPDFHTPVPEPHRFAIRAVPHPAELDARGIPITCPNCRARRDWLLLNVRHQVFVRCRCAAEWHEPDLSRAYFDQHFTESEREWESFGDAMTALGFDGLLAGTVWN
ncbi:hypothetical protein ACGF12_00735 [Kitasatospora sp. NPDC048296]|uniref:hypothetical protein n=1 Tax=Kitasatospora sp. NPDC048296 TaxID=3364048 RepID=UPI003721BE56